MADFNWREIYGCSAWFNPLDAFLEIVSHTKTMKVSSNDGPVWTVVGERGDDLLITVNGVNISTCPKKYTRVLKPIL